jgi:hypothetical protein
MHVAITGLQRDKLLLRYKVASVTSRGLKTAVHRCTLRLTDVSERVRRALCSAHGQPAVSQSPCVTACVCLCERQESDKKLQGQKWPKRVQHDVGGDWSWSGRQQGTVAVVIKPTSTLPGVNFDCYVRYTIFCTSKFPITYIRSNVLVPFVNVNRFQCKMVCRQF